jgi:hypothetical protein
MPDRQFNHPDTSDDSRARRLATQRRLARERAEKMRVRRKLAVATGAAAFLSPTEFALSAGLHVMIVYRMVAAEKIKAKKLGDGKRGGRLLIYADQLPRKPTGWAVR